MDDDMNRNPLHGNGVGAGVAGDAADRRKSMREQRRVSVVRRADRFGLVAHLHHRYVFNRSVL